MTDLHHIFIIAIVALSVSTSAWATEDLTTANADAKTLQLAMDLVNEMNQISVAQVQLQTGVQVYYRTFGRWPSSWSEVMASGIWQKPLVGPQGQAINPDDGKIDVAGDTLLDTSDGYPRLVLQQNGMFQNSVAYKNRGKTTADLLSELDAYYPDANLSSWVTDTNRMKQFGVLGSMRRMISHYKYVFGDHPKTIDEFIASGFSPVDRSSINPVTGQPFKFDGSANDIYWKYLAPTPHPSSGKLIGGFQLIHVLPDGSLPKTNFSY
jgi:hypothetical protein